MTRGFLAAVLSLATWTCMPCEDNFVEALSLQTSTRRSLLSKVPAFIGGTVSVAFLTDVQDHVSDCPCNQCVHGASCSCSACDSSLMHRRYGPPAAVAYDRDVGGADRSAETAAFNIQAKETNARLERSGFKLDTREEEASRLSEALSSFSYDASTPNKKQSARKSGSAKKSENSRQTSS